MTINDCQTINSFIDCFIDCVTNYFGYLFHWLWLLTTLTVLFTVYNTVCNTVWYTVYWSFINIILTKYIKNTDQLLYRLLSNGCCQTVVKRLVKRQRILTKYQYNTDQLLYRLSRPFIVKRQSFIVLIKETIVKRQINGKETVQ